MRSKPDFPRAIALAKENDMFPSGSTVLAAVSGGKDSMSLHHWLNSHAEEWGITLAVGHYHHGLRPEADADLELVENWCREQKIPFFAQRGRVAEEAARTGRGVEETGRALRYQFLEETARKIGAVRIVTAHNADDNAETLLLHLTRGTGLQGLTGIPPRRGQLVRPLLTTPRAEIEAYVEAYGIPFAEDATNADTEFVRNRLRHQVTPVLQSVNPRYVDSVSQTISLLRADQDYLNEQAEQLLKLARQEADDIWISCRELTERPTALTTRLVMKLLEELTGKRDFSAAHIRAVLELAGGSGEINLPHKVTVRRVYDDLQLTTCQPQPLPEPLPLQEGENRYGTWTITVSGPIGNLIVRSRQEGDEIRLAGRHRKSLKKWMIEQKIPRSQRPSLPVVADEQGVLTVAGLGENTDHPRCGKVQIVFAPNKNKE